MVYNSSGLVTDAYDARGVHSTLSYDGLNRVTQITYSDSTPTAHYYYDSQTLPSGAPSYTHGYSTGRLLAMTYGSGATGTYLGYDSMGRINVQKQVTGSSPTTYSLSYTYNYAGELASETYPSGRSLTYSYGAGARLSSVSDGTTTFTSSLSYDPSGGLSSETWGNTAVHTMTYNHAQQVAQAKLTLSGTVLQQYDYNYGAFNTSSGAVDTTKNNGQLGKVLGTIGSTAQWNQGFSYDEVGRISNVTEHQGSTMTTQTYSQSYGYDRYGNRNQSANSTLGLPAVASTDYSASTNRFGSSLATYDNSGNITTDSKFRSLNYSYDANGRQTSATNGSWTETQTYDCAGQRVQTSAFGSTRTLVYDVFGQLVADYNGSSGTTLESENIYRGGQLLARYNAGTSSLTYVLTDVQGSARTVMNNNGGSSTVASRHDYLPFGEEIASGIGLRTSGQGYGGTDYNRSKYALTERDDVTGLDHTWWRKYESLGGRWTSPDPLSGSIGDPQSFNAFSYSGNDPLNDFDPNGLFKNTVTPTWSVTVTGSWDDMTGYLPDWTSNDISSLLSLVSITPISLISPQNTSQLPLQQRIALDTAKAQLVIGLRGAFGEISDKCKKNVLDKLASIGFTVDAFTKYLEKGNDFYDGPASSMALSTATAPGQITGTNLPNTIGDLFAAVPGITALTSASLSPARLTIFFRSGTVDTSPDSAHNRALLFHEGLHGYGSSLTGGQVGMYGSVFGAYGDYGLLKLFSLNTSGPTSQITKYIQDNCF